MKVPKGFKYLVMILGAVIILMTDNFGWELISIVVLFLGGILK